jgi:hypothetical protein
VVTVERASQTRGAFVPLTGTPREQLQQVLAAEMSWHHAALAHLVTVPKAMADTDRYVAGEISLTQLVHRIRDHDVPE